MAVRGDAIAVAERLDDLDLEPIPHETTIGVVLGHDQDGKICNPHGERSMQILRASRLA